jgi:hypothetical protein
VQLNRRLPPVFTALQRFADDPMTKLGIDGLQTTTSILRPTVADLAPTQTVCNYATLFFRNIASLLSEGDKNGTWQRFIIVAAPTGPNNEGGPADAPANGAGPSARQVPSPAGGPTEGNFLHTNPLPNSPGGGRTNECESGNEPWLPGRTVIGNVPGNQGTDTVTTKIVRDSEGSLPSSERPQDQGGPDAEPQR